MISKVSSFQELFGGGEGEGGGESGGERWGRERERGGGLVCHFNPLHTYTRGLARFSKLSACAKNSTSIYCMDATYRVVTKTQYTIKIIRVCVLF